MSLLPADFVARYARPPSPTTVSQAVSVHENVRALLGDAEYVTFLQGSYKNDTALWDMNDVDIVAVARGVFSTTLTGRTGTNVIPWDEIFSRIERKLQSDPRYQGKWKREDKCIRLNTGVKIDIVPAVHVTDASSDPIAIFSFRAGRERPNWPRHHYEAGTAKSGRTNGGYKQGVRLFKRWARCWFGSRKVAPSYYIECLMHQQPDHLFTGDLARDFATIGSQILQLRHGYHPLPRPVGQGNLLSAEEWDSASFQEFQQRLGPSVQYAKAAAGSYSEAVARSAWASAFNGQQP